MRKGGGVVKSESAIFFFFPEKALWGGGDQFQNEGVRGTLGGVGHEAQRPVVAMILSAAKALRAVSFLTPRKSSAQSEAPVTTSVHALSSQTQFGAIP